MRCVAVSAPDRLVRQRVDALLVPLDLFSVMAGRTINRLNGLRMGDVRGIESLVARDTVKRAVNGFFERLAVDKQGDVLAMFFL